jgi:hypothetical protein
MIDDTGTADEMAEEDIVESIFEAVVEQLLPSDADTTSFAPVGQSRGR